MAKTKGKVLINGGNEYILGTKIGDGGNGTVYQASVRNSTCEYAIKFLKKDSDCKKVRRFQKEIDFCNKTTSQYIVKCIGSGKYNGQFYCIMPKYQMTLKEVIKQEKDPFKLLEYAIKLCEAICFIHNNKIIHRDIKPENIFVKDNVLALGDFGISHFQNFELTKSNDWLGNKVYAAPEQLLKKNAKNITEACDVYAFGEILNELFTKNKPSGSKYITISKIEPLMSSLDDICFRCLLQDARERPSIQSILCDLKLELKTINDSVNDINACLSVNKDFPGKINDRKLNNIAKDILLAQNLLVNKDETIIKDVNINYHSNIHYRLSKTLKDQCFVEMLYQCCLRKFNYEGDVLYKGHTYIPLNLDDSSNRTIYNAFKQEIQKNVKSQELDSKIGITLKLFSACCDYHCIELISQIPHIKKEIDELDDAPLLYIITFLREKLNLQKLLCVNLIDYIEVIWAKSDLDKNYDDNFYINYDTKTVEIVEVFEKKWNVICNKMNDNNYLVRFKSREEYIKFRNYSLNLAKPYYIFEGDVLALLRINRSTDNIIELYPLGEFEIMNVLAKILGVRDID